MPVYSVASGPGLQMVGMLARGEIATDDPRLHEGSMTSVAFREVATTYQIQRSELRTQLISVLQAFVEKPVRSVWERLDDLDT